MRKIPENYQGYLIQYRPEHSMGEMKWIAGIVNEKFGFFEVKYNGETFKELKKQIGNQII